MSEVMYDEAEDYGAEPEPEREEGVADQQAILANINNPNIARDLDDTLLAEIGQKVVDEYEIDEASRKTAGWTERYDRAMALAQLVEEAKDYPWPKASNVKYPLTVTAAIQFNARAYPAIVDSADIVKAAVKGRMTPEKQDRAERVGKHMSFQLLEEMDGWEEDTDRLLIKLPVGGCAFRKTWFDPVKGYNCSHLVSAKDFVVEYMTKDLDNCPRSTHILTFYPHEVASKMRSGLWLDVDLQRPEGNDDQAPHVFLEQHRLWDLDEDGYPEPYVVTVEKETGRVVRIVARYDESGVQMDDQGRVISIAGLKSFTKYGFIPAPDGSFYDIGFGTLLGPLEQTINSTVNQIMDAGHLANLGGGFIGDGVSIKSGNMRFRPGEWKKAANTGQNLAQSIVPLPAPGPNAVLFSLMTYLVEAAKDVTATQDILGGDAGKGTMPVGTVSALIEQGLKTFTAIVKRLHRSLKKELAILYRLNGRYLNPEVYFTFQDKEGAVARDDYRAGDLDIVPVSDPNMATDMQRMAQAQFVMQFMGAPGMNPQEIIKRSLAAARVPEQDALFSKEKPAPDPAIAHKDRELDIREREVAIKDNAAAANMQEQEARIAKLVSETMKTTLETLLAGPQFQLAAMQASQAATAALTSDPETGPTDEPQPPPVRPEEFSGMEEQPAEPGFPGLPEGPTIGPDEAMGLGPGDGSAAPDQGAPFGRVGGPELV